MKAGSIGRKGWALLLFLVIGFGIICADQAEIGKIEWKQPRKRTLRALIECIGVVGSSAVNYWIKYDDWMEDWQFNLTWKDQTKRIFSGESYRFDSNSFLTNWAHAISGAMYYNFFRTNGFQSGSSFLYALATSTFWEYIVEWREVISLNDQVFTAFGGWAIGEPLYQLSQSFLSQPDLGSQILGTILNPLLAINNLLERKTTRSAVNDAGSFYRQSTFHLGPAQWKSNTGGIASMFHTGFDFRLTSITDFFGPGKASGMQWRPLYSQLELSGFLTPEGKFEEHGFTSKVVLFGYWEKDFLETETDPPQGSGFFVGATSAFQLYKRRAVSPYDRGTTGNLDPRIPREVPTEFRDKMAVISVIGPSYRHYIQKRNVSLRFGVDLTVDFAMVNSLPYNTYSLTHDVIGLKTTQIGWGYFYGVGYTLIPELQLKWGAFSFSWSNRFQGYRSVNGVDRFEEKITNPGVDREKRIHNFLGLGFSLPKTPMQLMICYDSVFRKGTLGTLTASEKEERFYYRFQFTW